MNNQIGPIGRAGVPPILRAYIGDAVPMPVEAHCDAYHEAERQSYVLRDNEPRRAAIADAMGVSIDEIDVRHNDWCWQWEFVWEHSNEEYIFAENYFTVDGDLIFYDSDRVNNAYFYRGVDWLRIHGAFVKLGYVVAAVLWELLIAKFSYHELTERHVSINEERERDMENIQITQSQVSRIKTGKRRKS